MSAFGSYNFWYNFFHYFRVQFSSDRASVRNCTPWSKLPCYWKSYDQTPPRITGLGRTAIIRPGNKYAENNCVEVEYELQTDQKKPANPVEDGTVTGNWLTWETKNIVISCPVPTKIMRNVEYWTRKLNFRKSFSQCEMPERFSNREAENAENHFRSFLVSCGCLK